MNIAQIETNLSRLVDEFSEESFIYDLLLAYGTPKATVSLLKRGKRNLSDRDDQVILKRKLFFQSVKDQDLHLAIDSLNNDSATHRHSPRFIIVTDYKRLLAIDTKTEDSLDIDIKEINKTPTFFLPWAGMEKERYQSENPADVKAAERMAKLYDAILKDNEYPSEQELHTLNVFLCRLLFCYFAEDTGIFEQNAFTNSVSSHTQPDGSDLDQYLSKLFDALNTEDHSIYPKFLADFPYVNGGLFNKKLPAPKFSRKSRRILIECGRLNWSAINPDIFGSMIQAVVHPDQRGGMGMHYTSVPNIMKIIEPLFLDELKEDFNKFYDSESKLNQLLTRLGRLQIFDPACGSGNFLIISYKEIRRLEMKVFLRMQEISQTLRLPFSHIHLSQFYGIELDDFAHEIAILSLWLAEHQMNMEFKEIFGRSNPALPLKESGNIVCGDATKLDWEIVCPKKSNVEIYVLGNPPYLGSKNQSEDQKSDMASVFQGVPGFKKLDYISCWFKIASDYFSNLSCGAYAFVSTNSICQGEQVCILWPYIFAAGCEIIFAYQSFHWSNSAKNKAGVTCVIVGVSRQGCFRGDKSIFVNGLRHNVKNISPYLISGSNLCVTPRSKSISKLPVMVRGSQPTDDGNLILSKEEKEKLLIKSPVASRIIKRYVGSDEFINGKERWCLWIEDKDLNLALSIPDVKLRIEKCETFRKASKKQATRRKADTAYRFDEVKHKDVPALIFPILSSSRREYVPIGFLGPDFVISNLGQVVYDPEAFIFGILTSKMHMLWMVTTSSKMRSDYRYSIKLSYNTFPLPFLSDKQKELVSLRAYDILEEREKYPEKTMAELYDPDLMPSGLRMAHKDLDLMVERCYRSRSFESDEDRLECLFKLYEEMIKEESAGAKT